LNASQPFFDTLTVELPAGTPAAAVHSEALKANLNLRPISESRVGITLDETVAMEELLALINAFARAASKAELGVADLKSLADKAGIDGAALQGLNIGDASGEAHGLARESAILTQPIFSAHRSETDLLRYIHHLQSKDLSLVHSMIPLGSCTMKLNSTTSMSLLSSPQYGGIHPFAPTDQSQGYAQLIAELEEDLCQLTGFPAVSLQPNSGAQGEFAGLSVIRAYLDSTQQGHRDVCLVPNSAHGTNPASAVMAGMRVVAVKNGSDGNLDLDDLREKAEKHKDNLAAFMVTYPSTHGVFEAGVREACEIIHANGGQVYMDGANMQAQVGLTNPAVIGADVTHLNLHKTFSIPHGGGGPGVGPICCAAHLAPFLPGHPLDPRVGGEQAIDSISAAPWGSASILTIAWAYIKMLGWEGLRKSSTVSLLSANYMAKRLAPHYKLRYTNEHGRCAHEFLLDLAEFGSHNITVSDVAKRLSDYGFHAPTCSWPISTGLLIEPTESESLAELDRFCEAMISIRGEIQDVMDGKQGDDKSNNSLKNAPHTVECLTDEKWDRPYSRETAVFPVKSLREKKFWPAASRLNDAHGDMNLVWCVPRLRQCSLTASLMPSVPTASAVTSPTTPRRSKPPAAMLCPRLPRWRPSALSRRAPCSSFPQHMYPILASSISSPNGIQQHPHSVPYQALLTSRTPCPSPLARILLPQPSSQRRGLSARSALANTHVHLARRSDWARAGV
jgi:glycine dehydrogenase